MSLWSFQHGQVRRWDLWGSLRGLDCFLCCPGPSLRDVREELLHVPGAAVIAVNTAYPRVRPDVWIGMDRPECYAHTLLHEPFLKVLGSRYSGDVWDGGRLADCPNVCFASGSPGRPHELFDRLAAESLLLWNGNTFQTALHLAFWLGCRRVNLVGCDFGGCRGSAAATHASDYHDGRVLSDDRRERNRLLYRQLVDELPLVRMEAEKRGMELVSCTPDSPANEYLRFVPLEEAAERAAENVPLAPQGPPLDAADAELCRWGVRESDAPGVIAGCDARQEWLLPWWWEHYRQHNDYPVAFANLGMTPAARAWCAARGTVLDVPRGRAAGWFAKPLAILRCPFRWTLWLDLDCEVRGPLAEAFAYADRGLAVTADPYYPQEDGYSPHFPQREMGTVPAFRPAFRPPLPVLSTGVVAVRHGEPAVQMWAAQVFRRLERIRDDQAALNEIRDDCRESIVLMPRRFHHLRLAGPPAADALVVHWTGPDGKRLIQEKISRDARDAGDRDKGKEEQKATVQSEELIHVG